MIIRLSNPRLQIKPQASPFLEEIVPDAIPESPVKGLGELVLASWKLLRVDSMEQDLQNFLSLERNLSSFPIEPFDYAVVLSDLSFRVVAFLKRKPENVPEGLISSLVDPAVLQEEFYKAYSDPKSTLERIGLFVLQGPQILLSLTLFDPEYSSRPCYIFPITLMFDCLLEEFYTKETKNFNQEIDPKTRAQYYIALAANYVTRKILEDKGTLEDLAPKCGLPVQSRNAFWKASLENLTPYL